MKQLITYLSFNGNCKQAMQFYQDCLGGKLYLQTVGESPMSAQLRVMMKNCILHAHLQHDRFQLMGTDMGNEERNHKGNAVSIMLDCSTREELNQYYRLLSVKGKMDFPLEQTFWNAWMGGVTDRFGIQWILYYGMSDQQ